MEDQWKAGGRAREGSGRSREGQGKAKGRQWKVKERQVKRVHIYREYISGRDSEQDGRGTASTAIVQPKIVERECAADVVAVTVPRLPAGGAGRHVLRHLVVQPRPAGVRGSAAALQAAKVQRNGDERQLKRQRTRSEPSKMGRIAEDTSLMARSITGKTLGRVKSSW